MSENAHSDRDQLLAECKTLRARLEAAEKGWRRAELLAESSAVLSASLDRRVVLDEVARLVVRSFADWCVIDLVEDGEIVRGGGAHADPEKQLLLDELQRRYPPSWDSPHPATQVLKTGTSLLLGNEDLRRLTQSDDHRQLVVALGARSGLSVALSVGGRILGAVTSASGNADRTYGQWELDLFQEIAHRAAIAIQNALAYHQILEAVRLRDEFLSVASHELNTPMAALMLSLEGLGTAQPELQLDAEGMVQVAKLAERQGKRLTKLIGDLLDVTRMSRGALELYREDVELTALVREVVARYKPELERAGCDVSLHLSGPIRGKWDPMRLDQVVLNLLANAAKFGARRPIEINLERTGDEARLSVTDHGIGVDATQQARIFERFERGVASRNYGGLGLGLYICKRIVESHGGTIQVDSSLGRGATFTVQLPCVEIQAG